MKVTYRDGVVETVGTDQGDVQAFELWALRRGISSSADGRTLLQDAPVLFIRVAAWSATQRATGQKIDFDAWQATVLMVEPDEPTDVGPTPASTPDTP